jgi:hypothetical protein
VWRDNEKGIDDEASMRAPTEFVKGVCTVQCAESCRFAVDLDLTNYYCRQGEVPMWLRRMAQEEEKTR